MSDLMPPAAHPLPVPRLPGGKLVRSRSEKFRAQRSRPGVSPVPVAGGEGRACVPPFAQDEEDVAGIDEEAAGLAGDEDRVAAVDGVEEEGHAAADREEPER